MKYLIFIFLLFPSSVFAERVKIDGVQMKKITKAYDLYGNIHRSFYEYNINKIVTDSQKLVKYLESEKTGLLKNNFQLSIHLLKKMSKNLKRKKANEIFHGISMNFVSMVEKYKIETQYNVFECPMVQKKWVQNINEVAEIHNPYAPSMPNCGRQITNFGEKNEN